MPIKRCGGGCGGFERGRARGHNDTENKKGPPFGEPFLILRMGHQESKRGFNT